MSRSADDDRDDDRDDDDDEVFDILTIIEAMGTHFHERHDAVVRWSWKLFCVKWARLTVQVAELERDRRAREREREQRERWQEFRDHQTSQQGGQVGAAW